MQRTRRRTGRGGSTYSSFELSEYDNETLTEAGRVSRNEVFDRAAYFLERVIPVAESYQIQMACHLNDPPAPVLNGVEKWNWPVFAGLKRFSQLVNSPTTDSIFAVALLPKGWRTQRKNYHRSSNTSPKEKRSSTFTSEISVVGCTTFAKPGPTKATSTCIKS